MSWPRISAVEAERAMRESGAVYLDVRTLAEFELGHPAGAYHVPWELQLGAEVNPDFVSVVTRAFGAEQALIVGCRTGRRSSFACAQLLAVGVAQLAEQHGGYAGKRDAFGRIVEPGWQSAGLPIETGALPGRSYAELRVLASAP